jgi:choline-glycine betaine transporter
VVNLVRAAGWALFGLCAIAFIAAGGFKAAREGSVVAAAALIGMPVSMFVSATFAVVSNWRAVRRTRLKVPRAPSYTIRPLDPPKDPDATERRDPP